MSPHERAMEFYLPCVFALPANNAYGFTDDIACQAMLFALQVTVAPECEVVTFAADDAV